MNTNEAPAAEAKSFLETIVRYAIAADLPFSTPAEMKAAAEAYMARSWELTATVCSATSQVNREQLGEFYRPSKGDLMLDHLVSGTYEEFRAEGA